MDEFIHATTIASNTLLGQYGLNIPRLALVTAKGFEDVIDIGRQNRPSIYDLNFRMPANIVERKMRLEVYERINFRGDVVRVVGTTIIPSVI